MQDCRIGWVIQVAQPGCWKMLIWRGSHRCYVSNGWQNGEKDDKIGNRSGLGKMLFCPENIEFDREDSLRIDILFQPVERFPNE